METKQDVWLVEDLKVFEVMNSPIRQRLMRQFHEPKTVKAVAEALDVPVTRLYHHVNQLADVGVIAVVEERKAGAMIERVYQTSARQFAPGPGLLEGSADPAEMARVTAGVVLDPARIDAEAALEFGLTEGSEALGPAAIGREIVLLSPERAREVADRINDMLHEMDDEDTDRDDLVEYGLTITFFPLAGS